MQVRGGDVLLDAVGVAAAGDRDDVGALGEDASGVPR
jgi:hypothetical protein